MDIKVLRGGMLTTVQDLGRAGHRAIGVPLSGAMDPFALRVANLLVGNAEDCAAVECTLIGPELVFSSDVLIAVTGATFRDVPAWRPLRVRAGVNLKLGPMVRGCRGYIAVSGGIDVPSVLGSRSTYLRGRWGGFGGRALRDGDVLSAAGGLRQVAEHWQIDERILPKYTSNAAVRAIRGIHADELGGDLFGTEFKVMSQSDRMGVRLAGARLARIARSPDLVSTAVDRGTIQAPPDGQPIVLMADAQTIGGYAQAANVAHVDLPVMAQLKPGDTVRFTEVTLSEAQQMTRARERALGMLHEGLNQKLT